jgi:hypothetical protein
LLDPDVPLRVAHANVHSKVFEDEVVILDMGTGTYHSLRGGGVGIWELVLEQSTPATVVAAFTGDDIAAEVDAALAQLVAAGVVVADPTIDAGAPPVASRPFAPVEIETFTDMQDVLLLDPIHEVDEAGWPHALP